MMRFRPGSWVGIAGIVGMTLTLADAGCSSSSGDSSEPAPSTTQSALYDRLGKHDGIAKAVDAIVAQGAEAGAHRGTFAGSFEDAMVPTLLLVEQIRDAVACPVIASGGLMDGHDIQRALARDPDMRYRSVEEFRRDLTAALRSKKPMSLRRALAARPTGSTPRARPGCGSRDRCRRGSAHAPVPGGHGTRRARGSRPARGHRSPPSRFRAAAAAAARPPRRVPRCTGSGPRGSLSARGRGCPR